MALPRKWSRRIVVHGETYIWYLKRNEIMTGWKHIAIRHSASPQAQLLLLDCYAHDFEFGPGMVRRAIEFALANGWTPQQKAAPLYLGFDNVQFVRLPPGEQYLQVYQHPPSVTWITPDSETT